MLRGMREIFAGQRGNLFVAYATGVTPAIYSSTSPASLLLYNGSASGGGRGVHLLLLAATAMLTTASTVAGSLGIAIGTQNPVAAPTTTTAITLAGNLKASGPTPQATALNKGTVNQAPSAYFPIWQVNTGAITVDTLVENLAHLGGGIEIPPGSYAAIGGGAALTTSVFDLALVWTEQPND